MRTILVPTDFSANADKALNYAVEVAKKAKAKIVLMHACDLFETPFNDRLSLKKKFNRQITKEANEKLSAYCKSITETEKISILKKVYNGLVSDTIVYAAKANKADIIIMGTLGSAGVKEKILGSKTASVISRTEVPVLAIPLLAEWKTPEHILFAIRSLNEGRKDLVKSLIDIAELFSARITIAKFFAHFPGQPHKQLAIERAGNSYIKSIRTWSPSTTLSFVHPEGHRLEKSIGKYITQNNVDILAMITHKRNLINSIFHRSMTKKMSYHSAVPLLVLPSLPAKKKTVAKKLSRETIA